MGQQRCVAFSFSLATGRTEYPCRAEAALEKRILDAVSSRLMPFSASLDTAVASILERLQEREERVCELVSGAECAARETGKKVEEVEGELRKEVGRAEQRSAAEGQKQDEALRKKLFELGTGLEERLKQVEDWRTQVDGLEKRVEGIEGYIDRLEKVHPPSIPLTQSIEAYLRLA
jgi:hypothetical protein